MTQPTQLPDTQLHSEPTISHAQPLETGWWQRLLETKLAVWMVLGIASAVATGLVVGLRSLGGLQGLELWGYDTWMRQQPSQGLDPRLLIVGITDADVQRFRVPLQDGILSDAINRLQAHKPQSIGLDVVRDIPIGTDIGSQRLYQQLQRSDHLISVCKVGTTQNSGISLPPGISSQSSGFMDFVVDPDGVVRRNLLIMDPQGKCPAGYSLSLRLALRYLAERNILPSTNAQGYPQLGNTIFKPLESPTGGYAFLDARGYQVLLRYRSASGVARQVTLSDLLDRRVNPAWIQDHIVLIGYVAPSVKDSFYTPYTALEFDRQPSPGVVLHAQMLSQILSTVLDGQRLPWVLAPGVEVLWILAWAVLGASCLLCLRHPLTWVLATVGVLLVLTSISSLVFGLATGWLPWIPAMIVVIITNSGLILYWVYQSGRQINDMAILVNEQKHAIGVYKALFNARPTHAFPTPPLRQIPNLIRQTLAGRYYVYQSLAQGGFAHTFLAEDRYRPGSPICVLKCLQPATQRSEVIMASRRLFEIEAEILEKLGQHDQIPQLLAYFEAENMFCLVEEYIEGHSLEQELEENQPCSELMAINILQDTLQVLAFIHEHLVIHRDVKPSNMIRRRRDHRLVLIDFGAVKLLQSQEPGSSPVTIKIGTPGYAPPEQMAGHPVLSSDIYATGILVIQALSGLVPSQFPRDPHTGELDWQKLNLGCCSDLQGILLRMTRCHPGDRYPSVIAVLKDLVSVS